ncbi:hypothetical protein [Massilia sp. CF038]|uniref:hypothetical protein n=1 Tax=Massilia sp. CF038 TaxID=1881045 RepID=UPI0009177308|nr:hypothetical protein [Massilia sp. CF038]SHH67009.1 hypothetical protein SAMN05428948_4860 [Massilia sp. CF038]
MPIATTTLRWCLAATLAVLLQARAMAACDCPAPQKDSSGFLHLTADGKIALPENALGVLFWKKPALKTHRRDQKGNQILLEVPPKLKAKDFTIRDVTANRNLKVMLKHLDPGDQLGEPDITYYLMRKGAFGDDVAPREDMRILAEKYGLRDISHAVDDSAGLFRVAPAGGFIAGHVYEFENVEEDDDMEDDTAEVSVGPKLALSDSDKFSIQPQGQAVRKLLPVATAASCSARYAAIVQPVQYAIPAAREPYRHLLSFYTRQQFFGSDLGRTGAQPKVFLPYQYRSSVCAAAPAFGASETGPDKDIIFTGCPKLGVAPDRRLVRGYAAMLELEDTLHETPVLEMQFDQASGPACWRLRLTQDGGSASGWRDWLGE